MARTITFDREAAVELVMNEIWRAGFEACSVKSISEKLGITRSSFYNTFTSREALFIEALHLYFSKSPDKKLENFEESPCILSLLTRVFKEACRVRTSDSLHRGCMAVNSISELVGTNEELGRILEGAIHVSIDRFEALLKLCVKRGELPDSINSRHLALALQNMLIGLNVLSKVITKESELWAGVKVNLEALDLYYE